MKVTKFVLVLSMIAATGLSGVALAHQHNDDAKRQQRNSPHTQLHAMQRMLGALDLTDSQQAQIKQLMQQHRAQQKALPRDNALRQQLQQLVAADSFDEASARRLLQQQQQQQVEQRLTGLKLKHDILQLLSEEQRQQLAEKQQKWQQKRQQRHSS
ncbi:Spy/CpxP family protein refolding chaperone [Rheinheimera sp.]|uniref:Spy/CpxP family protein refolding chaperone n=1 Tax=Rheinheimera sp. TaxID=1869214 RepID=UPI0040480154